ncbi:hypothetical protein O6H91_03G087200 [Diphasiastrum complanatum]|uniref:Uncharacterized protein n=1 Tax=Diphasiastrum complanatum TaxID=34168 RepID=A0ACC2E8Q8_DIPCM|nr:hypothetical protein O6H91_03G087200 [Diphasiastrum complanatum]
MARNQAQQAVAEDMFEDRSRRNPLVPLGAMATAAVLTAGLISFKQGNSQRGQLMMRARVVFQAATVALMVGTVYAQAKLK